MIWPFIQLTERAISEPWDKERQAHVRHVTDTPIYVSPDAIEAVRGSSDAPDKYASHLRMLSKWDLFVVETPEMIERKVNAVRSAIWAERVTAITQGIVDSR